MPKILQAPVGWMPSHRAGVKKNPNLYEEMGYAADRAAQDAYYHDRFYTLLESIPDDLPDYVVKDSSTFTFLLASLTRHPSATKLQLLSDLIDVLQEKWPSVDSIYTRAMHWLLDHDDLHEDLSSARSATYYAERMLILILPYVHDITEKGPRRNMNVLDLALHTASPVIFKGWLQSLQSFSATACIRASPLRAAIALYDKSGNAKHKHFCELLIRIHVIATDDQKAFISYLWQWCYALSPHCALLLAPYAHHLSMALRTHDAEGCTPLHRAILTGHSEAVSGFLRMGADPYQQTVKPNIPAQRVAVLKPDMIGMDSISLACSTRVTMLNVVLKSIADMQPSNRKTRTDQRNPVALLFSNPFVWKSGESKGLLCETETKIARQYFDAIAVALPRLLQLQLVGKYESIFDRVGKGISPKTLVSMKKKFETSNKP